MTRIFVYGTLKRGFSNHRELSGQVFIGPARTIPGFQLVDIGGYPGLVSCPTDQQGVAGELWAVDAAGLVRLDQFEGVDTGLYVRKPVPLQAGAGPAEAYFFPDQPDGLRVIGSSWEE